MLSESTDGSIKCSGSSALAIFGGKPIRKEPMPARRAFGNEELASLIEAANYYYSKGEDPPYQGRYEKMFCEEFSAFMGGGYTDAVATGTASVFVALAALELERGSEVIISPVTDSGPLNCIIMLGLIPVVADAAPGSYNMGLEQFVSRITPRTRGLLAVHSAGEPLAIGPIVTEAHKRGIKVLEDCSQAPGALYQGKKVGTFGDIAAFSTMYRKTLTAGASGGIVFSPTEELYRKGLAHADRGKMVWRTDLDLRNPEHSLYPALNLNTDEFSCAIGVSSLRRLQDSIDKRVEFLKGMLSMLHKESKVCMGYAFHEGFSPFYFPIFVDASKITCSKDEFAKAVCAEGIPLLPRYGCLVCSWPWAKPFMVDDFQCPNAMTTRDSSFNFFLTESYTKREAEDVVQAIVKVEKHYSN